MEHTAPMLPMNELRALLSEVASQHADKVFAHYPFEFFPRVVFDVRWQQSPFLGRYLISNFKKGWFVYLFCGVNAAVFAIWRYPSLLDLPSRLISSSQTKQQRQARSGRSSRGLGSNVRTIHDLNRDQGGASSERFGSFLSLQNEANHLQTLRRHFTISLDNTAQGRWWTIFGGAVSHQDLDHIVKNLTTFISVATIGINRGLSNGQLLCVCLGSAVAGSVAQLWHFTHKIERDRQSRRRGVIMTRYGLGASGIVSGLSVAVAVVFPYTQVQKFAGMLPMPLTLQLWTVPLISFAYDMWMLNDESSKIGHGAHLGGAIFGGLYSFFALRRLTSTTYRL
ncbi:hypothetical protein GE21DRAFT_9079 [Neurospora crassa]|uniref:Peptidase S54 rhomboid domain-containing protein n=1 Tax=Neurospora crassa (strain ATCC 24698 / 74-OR23-1A / CBS 708.71 / DSM 1257 / FGSC 987) TaxID=367110 RepID=V5IKQ2_NEUCR|nr:hypothetical protein NCU12120 [Neurospora crassa OR74A]ESA42223.1 hypothetical protein NCU12120 [Neurospora crassa OR74A]KHE79975.1 hypothetical protein GE21DRAFT_9079 [Neurospora crassa]|eukprot:XP_011395056.1 hypothetical protein NCU12120 [Neurospora crassa OR74A]